MPSGEIFYLDTVRTIQALEDSSLLYICYKEPRTESMRL